MLLCRRPGKCNSYKHWAHALCKTTIRLLLSRLSFMSGAMDPERRTFVAFVSAALAMRSVPTNAQQATRLRTVGVLMGLADDAETQARTKAIEQGLAKKGWVAGQKLRIEYRFAGGDTQRMLRFSEELAALRPDVIIGHSTPVVAALLKITHTI